jgi:tRNA-5-taurinomethyluridine 2-sulfurtransferase
MKIAVLLSGGVDSAVALRLLKDQGHDVTAFYLKIWLEDELSFLGECPWEEDLKYVRKICKQASVPLEIINMQRHYFDTVVNYTINEVKEGRTPNPDIMCNNHIKFGMFFSEISDEYEKVATGHYAQTAKLQDKILLKKAPDPIKDQTYFLCRLNQDQLKRIIFPIGHLQKTEVRELADKYNLPNKDRKDSQGICFLGKLKYNEFLKHYLGTKPGDIIEYETGKVLGQHEGFFYHTIGQRRGIPLSGGPWFVMAKDIEKNQVFISKSYHEDDKVRDSLKVTKFNWFAGKKPEKNKLQAKLRHGEQIYQCEVDYQTPELATLKLNENDQGIAPGQFAVFYDEDLCLGSAMIT